MATVTVVTADKSAEIEAATIVGASVNSAGHLILTRQDGGEIDAGSMTDIRIHNGTDYVVGEGSNVYVGAADPGAVADGSVWFDTSA